MKPLNSDDERCDPLSSNCVIWQGPDIKCINLCKGDNVTKVVHKLATELCNLMDMFEISNYDLSCLDIEGCEPKDFKALIQLLIKRICELENIDPDSSTVTESGCPDCIVDIAECFYYENEVGDEVTTMQLTEYVTALGNRICVLVDNINTINEILENHTQRLNTIEQNLGNEKSLNLPKVTPTCVTENTGIAQEMNVVLEALEVAFCELRTATGGPSEIYQAIAKQCANLGAEDRLSGNGAMSSIPGWKTEVQSAADALTNMWLTMCDMRAAIKNIVANCCPSVCDDITVSLNAVLEDSTTLKLYFSGTAAGFTECNAAGTIFTISDSNGNNFTTTESVISNLNNATGVTIDLTGKPINSSLDLTITANLCLSDGEGSQCQSVLTDTVQNTTSCPTLSLTSSETSIGYSFSWTGSTASFEVELYDSTGTSLIASQTTGVGGPSTVSGSFTGLTGGTQYKVRVKITIDDNTTVCPFNTQTTVTPPCIPPTGLTAEINIT